MAESRTQERAGLWFGNRGRNLGMSEADSKIDEELGMSNADSKIDGES
jgi:hypothetical protein